MRRNKAGLAFVLAAALILNMFINVVSTVNVTAATVPILTMVTQPVKEYKPGDRISFTVASPNYGGKVEYRVILYNGTTKKTSELWNTPKTGYYYKGWQPAGNYKFTINWPATGMEPGAYSLTVLVRRVGATTPYDSYVRTNAFWIITDGSTTEPSVQPDSTNTESKPAAPSPAPVNTSVPQLQMVTQPAREYKPGDRISFTVTSPNYTGKVEYRVILYNGTTKKTSELWNTPATGYYYKNWQPAGNYNFTINWPAIGMEPGAYSLTVLVRRVGAATPYDSFVKTDAFWISNPGFPLLTGNSVGQSNYGATMIKQGDWLYYYDYIDKGLCMIKYDGTGKKKIGTGLVRYITVYNGWVYYVATETNPINRENVDRIRKVKLDGTGSTEIIKSDGDNNSWGITHVQVINDRVYYVYNGGIMYSDLNGGNKKLIHTGTSVRTMKIQNNYIYFTIYNEGHLKRLNLDGNGMTRITNEFTSYFSFDGDWAYYTVGNKLYRTSIGDETYTLPDDQSDYNNEQGIKDQIRETVFEKTMHNALIKDGWIYYNAGEDYTIHKVRLDGTGDIKLTPGPGGLDDIIGDWILYRYAYVQYRIKTDGTGQQKMFN